MAESTVDFNVDLPKQDFSIILGKHIIYTYENGWQYEYYFKSETEGHYRIFSGHVAGRWVTNRKYHLTNIGHDLIRVNWVEPVGNVVTMVVNIKERWLHSYFLMPQWIIDNPGPTICHEDEHDEEMLKLREQGPTWPMNIAENTFAKITYLEDVGPGRDDVITCPPDELPDGYADRRN